MNSFQICKIDKDRSYRWICSAACVQGGGQRQSFSPSTRHPCLWRHVWGCGWTLHSWSCPSCRWEPPEIARPLLHLWSGHPWWSAALSNGPRGSHLGRGELRGELMIRALAEWNGICACVYKMRIDPPDPSSSKQAKALRMTSSGSVPLSLSPNMVRNMVKLMGPGASLIIPSRYSSEGFLPEEEYRHMHPSLI